MKYRFQYSTKEELNALIESNKGKVEVEYEYMLNGDKFITFSDDEIDMFMKSSKDKISILEQENADKDNRIESLETLMFDLI